MSFRRYFSKMAIITIAVFSLVACDNDFNEVGSSIVDNNNFEAKLYKHTALEAQSEKIKKVQSNNLSSYALGVYHDSKYGRTNANILTQLELSSARPQFGEEPRLDS